MLTHTCKHMNFFAVVAQVIRVIKKPHIASNEDCEKATTCTDSKWDDLTSTGTFTLPASTLNVMIICFETISLYKPQKNAGTSIKSRGRLFKTRPYKAGVYLNLAFIQGPCLIDQNFDQCALTFRFCPRVHKNQYNSPNNTLKLNNDSQTKEIQ